jgi:acyl carrier protein
MLAKDTDRSLDKMAEDYTDLLKITIKLMSDITKDKIGCDLDLNKTWADNGFDDLDCIEMVMEIEKHLNIHISDEVAMKLFGLNVKPPAFIQYLRDRKLKELGI